MAVMLPPLFLEHFSSTSFVAEDDDGLAGFLVGFMSADHGDEAYAHFLGVRPDLRGSGLGRELHDRFATDMARRGARLVRCITSTDNHDSVAFHTAIGFSVDGEDGGRVLMSRRIPDPTDEPRPPDAIWPPDPATVLTGDWVELRLTVEQDAPELLTAWQTSRCGRTSTSPAPATAEQMRESLRELWRRGFLPWTVRLRRAIGGREAGTVVGWSSYLEVSVRDARCEVGATAYDPVVWGSKVNAECKLLLLGHAFEQLRMRRVQLKTDVRNDRSRRAIAALGAVPEGVLRSYQRRRDGTLRDTTVFSITTQDWPAVRRRLEHRLAAPEA